MPQTRENKGPEEILQDMAKEARDPWTYYYYGRPKRDIMLPIRVTAAERAAITEDLDGEVDRLRPISTAAAGRATLFDSAPLCP